MTDPTSAQARDALRQIDAAASASAVLTTPEEHGKLLAAVKARTDLLRSYIERAERAAADARRYRWLRDVGDATWRPFGLRDGCSAAAADAAIDAALAALPKEGDG